MGSWVMTREQFLATLPPIPDWHCCRCNGRNWSGNGYCVHCGGDETCGNLDCAVCQGDAPPMGPFIRRASSDAVVMRIRRLRRKRRAATPPESKCEGEETP